MKKNPKKLVEEFRRTGKVSPKKDSPVQEKFPEPKEDFEGITCNIERLTKEQIENWRTFFLTFFGPYALLMPEEDLKRGIQEFLGHVNDDLKREVRH